MGVGSFGDNGELYFEIQQVARNGDEFSIEALLDTGFTDGWLAINTQERGSFAVVIDYRTG
jgi:predicted aspartyl protease